MRPMKKATLSGRIGTLIKPAPSKSWAEGSGDKTNKPIMAQRLLRFFNKSCWEYSKLFTYFLGMRGFNLRVINANTNRPIAVAKAVKSTTSTGDRS